MQHFQIVPTLIYALKQSLDPDWLIHRNKTRSERYLDNRFYHKLTGYGS